MTCTGYQDSFGSRYHCNGCAEAEKLRAELERLRGGPCVGECERGTCAICWPPTHLSVVDDTTTHAGKLSDCKMGCWRPSLDKPREP